MEPLLYLFLFILGYFVFRLVANFILPVLRTVRVVRREFARHQADASAGTGAAAQRPNPPAGGKPTPNWDKMGDYIDFEEVK
jgi:hypothetical protein